jgi:KDO2-lipid IV(A) lauroyltransferase
LRERPTLRHWIEYALVRLVAGLLRWLPRRAASGLAQFCARLLGHVVPRLRRVARRNLELAMPGMAAEERERIMDGVFRSVAGVLVAIARFPSINRRNVREWIRYEGLEHYEEAKRRGRGVLFATAHLGNWELSAFAHALMAEPMHVVVRPLDNPLLDGWAARRRRLSGNQVIGKKDLARGILRALAGNEAVGVLIDQNTSPQEGVFVDFFGLKACAHAGFARLAARSGAAVIPGFALWSGSEHRYVLRFYPPVPMTGDVAADTQRLHTHLETVIREYPDQWLWIHRRWKTRPEGEPPIY